MKTTFLLLSLALSSISFGAELTCTGKQHDVNNYENVIGTYFIKATVLSNSAITNVQFAYQEENATTAPEFSTVADKVVVADQTYNARKYANYNRFNVNVMGTDEGWSAFLLPKDVLNYPQFFAYSPWGYEAGGGTQTFHCELK